jgi:hypothetical protein
MQKTRVISILLFLVTTLLLLPNFYRNRWTAVDPAYYDDWQSRYDRLVVARLVQSRQAGPLSAGALLGLGDVEEWSFQTKNTKHQYITYLTGREFQTYLAYKSNPGFQGIFFSLLDKYTSFPEEFNLKLFRGFTALLSAMVFGFFVSAFAAEFGLLSGMLTLLFAVSCIWIVLPAGSIFWDLWAFYAPFLAGILLLTHASRKNKKGFGKVYLFLFTSVLVKILFSGFDLTTTVLVMATVPFIFYAIYDGWDRRTFITRFLKTVVVLLGAAATGLLILGVQIIAEEGNFASAMDHIINKYSSYSAGSSEFFTNPDVQVRKITVWEVVPKYLVMPAINIHIGNISVQILYWQLILVFALFTVIFILQHGIKSAGYSRKDLAFMAATWYSILAPISWYVLFKPHAFIHTHVNTMGWQMPFTLLGFAFCGYVITGLVTNRNKSEVTASPLPS